MDQQRTADSRQRAAPDRTRRAPRARPLSLALKLLGYTFLILGAEYLMLRRADLPGFFPHARGASRSDDGNDTAMAVVLFLVAAFAFYGARYARTHRSWMRTRSWHRKHGRI